VPALYRHLGHRGPLEANAHPAAGARTIGIWRVASRDAGDLSQGAYRATAVAGLAPHHQVVAFQLPQLVVRRETGDRLGSVRYELTSYGKSLGPVFRALWQWGTDHLAREGAERGTLVLAPQSAAV